MTPLVANTFGNAMRRGSMVAVSAVGLVVVAWLTIGHVSSDEDLAKGAALRAAANSVGHNPSSVSSGHVPQSFDEVIDFTRARRDKIREVTDYTAVFAKTEFVNERLISQTMDLKFRQEPFSVYVRSHSKRQPAREAIFVAGRNDDKLTLHEAGIKAWITVNVRTDDARVMAENKYPITDIGMTRMLDVALEIWDREKRIAPANVEVLYTASFQFGSIECEEIRIIHKERLSGLTFHMTRVSFEIATGFPVLLEQYDWPLKPGDTPPLVEQYLYAEIVPNSGLTDADFDPENSEYHFGSAFR